jgi:SAM-dependent MidA family methyltransferase
MPVHRFRIDADREPQELFVKPAGDGWEEVAAEPVSPGLADAVRKLQAQDLAVAPGYESEINLRLAPWLQELGNAMDSGLALLIDYGYPRREYYMAERGGGTLMCHSRHRAHPDPYLDAGLQDITAHVDFTAAAEAAVLAGLRLAGFTTQAHFLIGCGLERLLSQAATDPNAMDLMLGAKQLVLPSAMGERFHAIALEKGVEGPWSGFSFRDLRERLAA